MERFGLTDRFREAKGKSRKSDLQIENCQSSSATTGDLKCSRLALWLLAAAVLVTAPAAIHARQNQTPRSAPATNPGSDKPANASTPGGKNSIHVNVQVVNVPVTVL